MSGDLIGSRISLISRKDIRWEGILVQVDRENASVTLQSVKSWGTEGRAEGIMQIPPAEQLHEMVMFRGEDIKDLHVHETAEPTPVAPMPSPAVMAPPPAHMMNNTSVASTAVTSTPSIEMPPPQVATTTAQPAIVTPSSGAAATVAVAAPASASSSASAPVAAARPNPVPPPPARLSAFVAPDAAAGGGGSGGGGLSSVATVTEPGEATSNNGETKAGEGSPPQTMRDQGQKPGRYQPPHRNPHWKPPQSNPRPASGSGASALPGQGNHLLNRRTRGAGSGPLNEDGEFDFEAGLAKFDKEKEMALLAGSMSATSIQSHGGSSMTSEGFINGEETEEQEAAAGDMGAGGVAAAAAAAAASAGERRTAADGGEIWVEPAVVVKKYNKSSFFDEISCDALDGRGRMPGGYGRERTRNTETFGATSVALSSASRRYGGRGGGGYSSYSGGGARRGGYGYGDNGYRGRPYNGDRGAGGEGGSGGGGIGGDRQDSSGSWRRN